MVRRTKERRKRRSLLELEQVSSIFTLPYLFLLSFING